MSKFQQETLNIWFPDQKEPIYDPMDEDLHREFLAYWKREKDRCINGFYLADGKVKISGHLYFHTVYWRIAAYITKTVNGKERKSRQIITPLLRDVDWDIINNDLETCQEEGKFYDLVGSRDFGKSIIAASRAGWMYTFFDKSESVISGGAASYIKLATDKIEDGLLNLHPMWKKQRITSDWKKEIVAGWKDKITNLPDEKSSFSSIKIRNYENGQNSMAANGTRPGFHLIDETGTIPNLIGCVKDSDGCWWSGDGDKPSCLVMRSGCLVAGSKVWTNDGRLINVEDILLSDGIIGYSGKSYTPQEINFIKSPELKECVKITTSGGNSIECSIDHPFLASSRNNRTTDNTQVYSFIQAQNLKIGDYLSRIKEVPIFGKTEIKDARLLGLFLGDGYFKGSLLCIDDLEINNYINYNYSYSLHKEYTVSNNTIFRELRIKNCSKLFKDFGLFNLTGDKKRLPLNIHEFDKKSLSEIIAGCFDSDGNVYFNKKKNKLRIVLTNISKSLLEDIKYQLLKFGIHSNIYKENRNTKPSKEYKGQKNYIYRLYIGKNQDIEKFINEIPLLHSKKVETFKLFRKGNRDQGSHKGIFKSTGLHDDEKFIENNSEINNFRFEHIVKIEFTGKKEVYNLNAKEYHTYIGNGFITHNTGGDMEVGKEAAEIFFAPEAYNSLAFDNPEIPGGKMGRFISALRAKMAYKEKKTLSEYLNIKHPDLDKITILVSDEERCYKEWWLPQYEKAKKSGNPKTLLKFKAYWPLKASDSFLVLTKNDYNVEAARKQKQVLISNGVTGSLVELFHDGTQIRHKFSEKLPITEFPVKTQSKDAPIQIWEFPISELPPFGLYVAGVDNYRQGKAEYSDSLGVVYIFKRMHDIQSEKYQDMLVAVYAARPDNPEYWNEQARLLIKFYNARTLCENDDMTFINYMISQGDGHYLEDQPQWLKMYVPNTTVSRDKGIHRSSEKIRDMLRAQSKKYLDEKIKVEKDDKGSVIKEILGVTRIPDPMLCEEISQFNEDEGNYDREVAFSLAIALANHLDPIIGKVEDPNIRNKSLGRPRLKSSLFSPHISSFKKRKTKLFNR